MHNAFVDLKDLDSLERFLELSNHSAIVIFKHSETCGISDRAYREMLDLAGRVSAVSSTDGQAAVPIGIIPIQSAREVSNEIEVRTGIDHESPQVFIIARRQVVWSTSHGGVRVEAIEKALREAASRKE